MLILILLLVYHLLIYNCGCEKYDENLQNHNAEVSGNLISGTVYASEYIHPGITWIL